MAKKKDKNTNTVEKKNVKKNNNNVKANKSNKQSGQTTTIQPDGTITTEVNTAVTTGGTTNASTANNTDAQNTNSGTAQNTPDAGGGSVDDENKVYNDLNDLLGGNYTEGASSALESATSGGPPESYYNNAAINSLVKPVLSSGTICGIFAMPYQFLASVDRRIDSTVDNYQPIQLEDKMGRKYADKIAGQLPLLFLTPCRARFMEGFSQSDVRSVIDDLLKGGGDDISGSLSKSGRYYTTEIRFDEYYACVNLMCAEVAYFCGIADEEITIGGKTCKIGDIDWTTVRNESFNDYFYAKDSVVLYADGLTTVSDSFSNTTTDSQLASSINGFSDTAKELRFVMGESSVISKLKNFATDSVSKLGEELGGIIGGVTGGMLGDLMGTGPHVILNGGKLLFPKIWGDSSFSRSYSFDIKLRSPDHDAISIFLNILVPYIHLLALCMPQSVTKGIAKGSPNAYTAPFLLRAYCKGQFNINMGMITDMSVTRGGEAQWNDNGLPTQMDISLTIEDLYNTLFMTNPDLDQSPIFNMTSITRFFNLDIVANTEMLDFLANLAGLNIAGEELNRKTKMVFYLTGNQLKRTPANIYNFFSNGISNIIRSFYE